MLYKVQNTNIQALAECISKEVLKLTFERLRACILIVLCLACAKVMVSHWYDALPMHASSCLPWS